jgi:hypothetical protein
MSDSVTISIDGIFSPQQIDLNIPTLFTSDQVFSIGEHPPKTSVVISDISGREFYRDADYSNDLRLNCFSDGVYLYSILLPSGQICKGRFVVVKM